MSIYISEGLSGLANWSTKTLPKCRRHHSMGLDPRLNEKSKGGSVLDSITFCNVTSCLNLLTPWWMHASYEPNKPLLPSVAFVRYFHKKEKSNQMVYSVLEWETHLVYPQTSSSGFLALGTNVTPSSPPLGLNLLATDWKVPSLVLMSLKLYDLFQIITGFRISRLQRADCGTSQLHGHRSPFLGCILYM